MAEAAQPILAALDDALAKDLEAAAVDAFRRGDDQAAESAARILRAAGRKVPRLLLIELCCRSRRGDSSAKEHLDAVLASTAKAAVAQNSAQPGLHAALRALSAFSSDEGYE